MVENLNNFKLYMPGGFYRDLLDEIETGKSTQQRQIIAAIDAHLAQVGFDFSRYAKIRRIISKSTDKFGAFYEQGKHAQAEHLWQRTERICNLEYEMLKPVYDRMVELGFPKSLLIA